jgi:hypothetical protein
LFQNEKKEKNAKKSENAKGKVCYHNNRAKVEGPMPFLLPGAWIMRDQDNFTKRRPMAGVL